MGKRLIVAEKPSVGRDIAKALNCHDNNNSGCIIGENDVITWAVGHLVGLCYPDEIDPKYAEWKMEDLPILPNPIPLTVRESGEKQFQIVKRWMNDPQIDSIVCATDAGREGELIFRYIYEMAKCSKPVERLWISSLTYRAIKDGFENLKPSSDYDNLYQSAKCRSEADWLVGMNGSRAYAIENQMRGLSLGRVLSPTLSILVQREKERRSFKPEEYCEVIASFGGYRGRLLRSEEGVPEESSRFSVDQKPELEQFVKEHSPKGTITFIDNNEERLPPQLLYDLTSLQRDANRIYGLSSQKTLDAAQALYEHHKAITYPRTDSRYLSSDIKSTLPKRLESLLDGELGECVHSALSSDWDLFGRFINNNGVSDHHAIIPTGEAKGKEHWTKQEKQVFDLIARRFVGMFLPDCVVIHQKIKTSVDGRVFYSFGENVIVPGWSAADLSKKRGVPALPYAEVGDSVTVEGMRVSTDKTKAPQPHTEASLLAAMEHAGKIIPEDSAEDETTEFGIGTPATRAATIEKMLDKEMAVRKGRCLLPTEYGIKLIEILPEILQSPKMTGEWEARLAGISSGTECPDIFMSDIYKLTKDIIAYAVEQGNTGIKDATSVGLCPLCGNPVREYETAYYCKNKECGFRNVVKAKKGFHPTLDSGTMRILLANGTAETEKGTYALIKEQPYIAFQRAPKQVPEYQKLQQLFEEYCYSPVNKVPQGGGLWLAGDKYDEQLRDFVRDCKECGCVFEFFDSVKALKGKSGWCHRVAREHEAVFMQVFSEKSDLVETASDSDPLGPRNDELMKLVRDSGFESIDKRQNGGCLWIIAEQNEGKALIDRCEALGYAFEFSETGGKATGRRAAWYSLKKRA